MKENICKKKLNFIYFFLIWYFWTFESVAAYQQEGQTFISVGKPNVGNPILLIKNELNTNNSPIIYESRNADIQNLRTGQINVEKSYLDQKRVNECADLQKTPENLSENKKGELIIGAYNDKHDGKPSMSSHIPPTFAPSSSVGQIYNFSPAGSETYLPPIAPVSLYSSYLYPTFAPHNNNNGNNSPSSYISNIYSVSSNPMLASTYYSPTDNSYSSSNNPPVAPENLPEYPYLEKYYFHVSQFDPSNSVNSKNEDRHKHGCLKDQYTHDESNINKNENHIVVLQAEKANIDIKQYTHDESNINKNENHNVVMQAEKANIDNKKSDESNKRKMILETINASEEKLQKRKKTRNNIKTNKCCCHAKEKEKKKIQEIVGKEKVKENESEDEDEYMGHDNIRDCYNAYATELHLENAKQCEESRILKRENNYIHFSNHSIDKQPIKNLEVIAKLQCQLLNCNFEETYSRIVKDSDSFYSYCQQLQKFDKNNESEQILGLKMLNFARKCVRLSEKSCMCKCSEENEIGDDKVYDLFIKNLRPLFKKYDEVLNEQNVIWNDMKLLFARFNTQDMSNQESDKINHGNDNCYANNDHGNSSVKIVKERESDAINLKKNASSVNSNNNIHQADDNNEVGQFVKARQKKKQTRPQKFLREEIRND